MPPQKDPLVISTRAQKQKAQDDADIEADKNQPKRTRVAKSKEPIVHPVPERAMFALLQLLAGTKEKVETEIWMEYNWNVEFDEILPALDERCGYLGPKRPRGTWAHKRTIGMFEEAKKPVAGSQFEDDRDWIAWKQKFATRMAETEKMWCFAIQYSFTAASVDSGVLPDNSETPRRSMFDGIVDLSRNSTTLTPASSTSLSQRSLGGQSVTNARESSMSDSDLELSRVVSQIERFHKCIFCKPGHCYKPLEGLPHLQLSHGCVSKWAKNVLKGSASIEKLPEWYLELTDWKKKFTVSTTNATSTTTNSPANSSMGMQPIFINWPGNSPGPSRAPEYAQGYAQNDIQDIRSSPPALLASQHELLCQWLDFTVNCGKELQHLDTYKILQTCKAEDYGMHAIREILIKKDISSWRAVSDFGITCGLARAMHQSLPDWQAYRRSHTDYN